jgi:hypothetical protein
MKATCEVGIQSLDGLDPIFDEFILVVSKGMDLIFQMGRFRNSNRINIVYVGDFGENSRIQKLDGNGNFIAKWE